MLTLFVLRHAKSDWDAGIARDFDRPINARGKAGARLMGEWLKREASLIDHIVSSPALRCAETLDLLWEGYGRILHPVWDKRAYLASVETLIDVIQDTPESAHSLLLCGHNPGCEELVELLCDGGDAQARAEAALKFPTATIAEIHFDTKYWADIGPGDGKLVRFVRPRDLDPALGPPAR